MNDEKKEYIYLTAQCLVYALVFVNRYPERQLRECAKGLNTDLTATALTKRLSKIYDSFNKRQRTSLANSEVPRAKKLVKWILNNINNQLKITGEKDV